MTTMTCPCSGSSPEILGRSYECYVLKRTVCDDDDVITIKHISYKFAEQKIGN